MKDQVGLPADRSMSDNTYWGHCNDSLELEDKGREALLKEVAASVSDWVSKAGIGDRQLGLVTHLVAQAMVCQFEADEKRRHRYAKKAEALRAKAPAIQAKAAEMTPDEERNEIRRLSEINRALKQGVPVTMFTVEALNALAAKLVAHADSVTNPACHDMQGDCRLAAKVCSNLAALRYRVSEIAEMALTQDPAATRRDLVDALADAACLSLEGTRDGKP